MLLPESVKIGRGHFYTHLSKIHEQLVLVVDQMLQIAQKQGGDGLAALYEDCPHGFVQTGILEQGESFLDTSLVDRNPRDRISRGTRVVHGQTPKLREVCKAQRFHGRQNGTESCQTIEQMAEE